MGLNGHSIHSLLWTLSGLAILAMGCLPNGSKDKAPSAPTVTFPTSSPYYSSSAVRIAGTCTTGLTVTLIPDDSTDSSTVQTFTCANGAFSFDFSRDNNGTYTLEIFQTDIKKRNSTSVSFEWHRDSSIPSSPSISSPTRNPEFTTSSLVITGGCTSGNRVNLTGSDTQSTICASNAYGFSVTQPTDGTYTFYLSQTTPAGVASATVTQNWIRDSTTPVAPTITSPSANPYYSSGTVTITGGCSTGMTVNLTGSDTQNMVCVGSAYSFMVTKGSDSTYNFNVTQTNLAYTTSSTTTKQWIRDSAVPSTNITANPTSNGINLQPTASFSFSGTDNNGSVTFNCKMDGGAYSACTSPITYSGLTNASHTFTVASVDQAGNQDPAPPTFTWTQADYNTVALYHLDNTNFGQGDSSGLSGTIAGNTLTRVGSANENPGQFNEARDFDGSDYFSVADNVSHALVSSKMTIEAWVKSNAPGLTAGVFYVIASKTGASPNLGWEFGVTKFGASNYLYFKGSANGTTSSDDILSTAAVTLSNSVWHHYAVTWDGTSLLSGAGTLKFYYDGSIVGSAVSIGGSITSLNSPNVQLRLGNTSANTRYLDANLDDVRISKIIRTITIPGAAYTAD